MINEAGEFVANRLGIYDELKAVYRCRTRVGRRDHRDNRNMLVLMAGVIGPSSNCLDLGANSGVITGRIVNLAPQGKHIAVEPVPKLAASLRQRFPSVIVHEVALSDHEGETTFYHAVDEPALSGLQIQPWHGEHDYRPITVRLATLDSLVPPDLHVEFIKIDVEGAHVLALRGAARVLESHPVIWLDHGAGAAALHGTTSRELWDLLVGYGYRLFDADGHGPLATWKQFSAVDRNPLRWTFIATARP